MTSGVQIEPPGIGISGRHVAAWRRFLVMERRGASGHRKKAERLPLCSFIDSLALQPPLHLFSLSTASGERAGVRGPETLSDLPSP